MLYLLWDLGLKVGHATRTVDQCLKLSRADMTIRTTLLDARMILGDTALFAELMQRFQNEVVHGTARAFVEAKLAERDARHERAGESRYRVEPNIKEGKGGLRDLHTLALARQVSRRQGPGRGRGGGLLDLHAGGAPHLPPLRGLPLDGALPSAFPVPAGRGAADLRRPARHGRAPGLRRARRAARGRALHEALLPGGQGGRRPHHHPVLGARDRAGQGLAGPHAVLQSVDLAHAPPHPHDQRFPHRQRPPERSRRRCLQARSGQPDPLLRAGRAHQRLLPSGRHPPAAPLAAPDRRPAAPRSGGQPHLPRDPVLGDEPGADPAAHERSRRARPLHSRLRQGRVDDAVQHVPPLHGGRAPDPHRRRAVRHRARRRRRAASAGHQDLLDHPEPPRPLRGGVPARHRQGAPGGSFDRGRAHRPRAVPALRHEPGRDGHCRLADRAASDHELGCLQPRHRRPQDHPRLRQYRAEPGAPEAAAGADHRRHPRRRPQHLERLEGPAAARPLLRGRAGAGRRPHAARLARSGRGRAGRFPPGGRLAGGGGRANTSIATIPTTGSRPRPRRPSSMRRCCAMPSAPGASSPATSRPMPSRPSPS